MTPITNSTNKIIKILYLYLLPFTTAIFLLGISSFIPRAKLFKSDLFDLLIRSLLTIWFCALYIRLSKISTFSIYPNKKWSKSDVGFNEKHIYLSLGIFLGIGGAAITWWMVRTFFPDFQGWRIAVAGLNGLIIMYPLLQHYWVLKL